MTKHAAFSRLLALSILLTSVGCEDDSTVESDEPELCGNGAVDGSEVCDGDVLGEDTCETLGFSGGELHCSTDCSQLDTTGCLPFPTKILLFIGDGMGFEHVKAGGMFVHGAEGTLSFEGFPHQGSVITDAAGGVTTDSAAAATAMATGIKVDNAVISMAIPGDGSELPTALELASDLGRATGLVTTTYVTHATPAAFGAHEPERGNYAAIASDFFSDSLPHVLFGGAAHVTPTMATDAGYQVIHDRTELLGVDPAAVTKLSGQFGADHLPYVADGLGDLPTLADMTAVAIAILERDPDGFLLMVEGGRIDHAAHANDITRVVAETAAFSEAVQVATDWAQSHDDVLIVVTADHETGGMAVVDNNGVGVAPTVDFTSTNHTSALVPIYALGPTGEWVAGDLDNTAIFDVITQ